MRTLILFFKPVSPQWFVMAALKNDHTPSLYNVRLFYIFIDSFSFLAFKGYLQKELVLLMSLV